MSIPTPSERLRELERTKYEAIWELEKLKDKFRTIKNDCDEEYVNLMDSLVSPYVGKYYKYKHPKMYHGEWVAFKILGTPMSSWTKMEGREYRDHDIPVLMLKTTDRYRGDDLTQRQGLELAPEVLLICRSQSWLRKSTREEKERYFSLSAFDHFTMYLESECDEITLDEFLEIIESQSIGLLDYDYKKQEGPEEVAVDVEEDDEQT